MKERLNVYSDLTKDISTNASCEARYLLAAIDRLTEVVEMMLRRPQTRVGSFASAPSLLFLPARSILVNRLDDGQRRMIPRPTHLRGHMQFSIRCFTLSRLRLMCRMIPVRYGDIDQGRQSEQQNGETRVHHFAVVRADSRTADDRFSSRPADGESWKRVKIDARGESDCAMSFEDES